MPVQPRRVRAELTEQFHKFLLGELAVEDLEDWVYNSKALEEDLAADDHLALLSLDYRRSDALYEVRKIVVGYVDLAAFETEKLRRILGAIENRTHEAFAAVRATYDLYCKGYYFLDNLGLGYGLSFIDFDDTEHLTATRMDELLSGAYPLLVAEAQRVLRWLDDGTIRPTGEEDETGQMGFVDNRSAEEKKPAAFQRAKPSNPYSTLTAWDRVRRALGLATAPEKEVKRVFQESEPGEHVAWTSLSADEPRRFVVGVFYGRTRPPRHAFFEVSKTDGTVRELDDDGPYRPGEWR